MSAYHLKDALIADQAVSSNKQDVEDAINASAALSLLADLANLDKHRVLNRKPRSPHKPKVVKVADRSAGTGWRLVVDIDHGSKVIDGVEFAQEAVDAWEAALRRWGLI